MDPVRPDYDGAWVGGVVPALLTGEQPGWLPAPARDADAVALLVLDGLGWDMLQRHRGRMPELAAMHGGPVMTGVPSTTAAGLTSIATGVPPAAHGMLGYRIRVGGEVLNVLRWPAKGGPDPAAVQPVPPFAGRRVAVVTRAEFRNSGFTKAHLRGSVVIGWKATSTLVEHVRRLAVSGRSFLYAYYDGIDKVAHEFGLHSAFLTAELAAADRLVGEVLDALPGSWALLVMADHGQVHVDADAVVRLGAVAGLVTVYAGEGRFRTLHARPGAGRELLESCRQSYGDRAWVLSRDELFDDGWVGRGAGSAVRARVGDVVLAAREPVMFLDPAMAQEGSMRSHHGSMTPAEMRVPLVAARGRAWASGG